jgi:hypothetical protein
MIKGGDILPVFATAITDLLTSFLKGLSALNKTLESLQKDNAKIIDVKLSTCCNKEGKIIRTYLIAYEAEKRPLH